MFQHALPERLEREVGLRRFLRRCAFFLFFIFSERKQYGDQDDRVEEYDQNGRRRCQAEPFERTDVDEGERDEGCDRRERGKEERPAGFFDRHDDRFFSNPRLSEMQFERIDVVDRITDRQRHAEQNRNRHHILIGYDTEIRHKAEYDADTADGRKKRDDETAQRTDE